VTSSIREMRCGRLPSRSQPRDGEEPCIPARWHSSLSWCCSADTARYSPRVHFTSCQLMRSAGSRLGHGPLARPPPGRGVGRRLPGAKPTLAPGVLPGRTRAGVQLSRDTDPFGNPLLASNRLQGLGSTLVQPQNIPPSCLNRPGSLRSQQREHPPALGPQHPPLPPQRCRGPHGAMDTGVVCGSPTPCTPLHCQEGLGRGCHPKQRPGPASHHKVTSLPALVPRMPPSLPPCQAGGGGGGTLLAAPRWVPAPRTTQQCLTAPSPHRCSGRLVCKQLISR